MNVLDAFAKLVKAGIASQLDLGFMLARR
jgi:hypothetical protein